LVSRLDAEHWSLFLGVVSWRSCFDGTLRAELAMIGFPTELRPLLVLVIVLAIAHMLLKGKARSAQARRAQGTHRAKSHTHAARAERVASIVASAETSTSTSTSMSTATSTDAQPIEQRTAFLPDDPAEALARLRSQSQQRRLGEHAGQHEQPHARHAHPD
jgi:FtsZ-interacting cell division protein ZipA